MVRKRHNTINRKRIYFLFFLFLVAFGLIVYRLVSIQFLFASKYKTFAEYQHYDEFMVSSKRGKILDRNGIELATSLIERTIYANPQMISNPEQVATRLSGILDMDAGEIHAKISDEELGFVYIKRKVSAEIAERVLEEGLEGIFVQNESKRYYPQDDLAASIIGFTGTDNKGLSGIELEYEDFLRGVDGKYIIEKDVFGQIIPNDKNNYIAPIDGEDVVLTIDSQIQFITQERLRDVVEEHNAKRAIAVVINPQNGEIYAIANHPGFDLNNYQDYEQELYKSLGIAYTYEPGSTFKIINIASAIENNTVGPEQLFNLPPSIQVGDKVIKEIFRTYNIDYTTSEIIQNSSNVGAVTVAMSMGKKMFYEGILDFGFRDKTGIDLPGEEIGILMDYEIWPSSTIGALAIGQTISVTPLQLVRAASAIANGGYLVTPHLLKEIDFSSEKADFPEFEKKDRIISEYTSSCLKDMMLSVVEEGTGTRAQIEGVQVCGKTGTAQKPNESGIGYTEGRVITSFLGFAPYNDPEIAVLVVVDEPLGNENEIWGGTVAAPVFKDIVSFALNRFKILDINN